MTNSRKELHAIRSVFVIRVFMICFSIISKLAIFFTLVSYVFFGHVFTPRQVFVVTTCFNFLYDSMLYFWTVAMTSLAENFVSMERIEEFLLQAEHKTITEAHTNFAFKSDTLWDNFCIPNVPPRKSVIINENSPQKCVVLKNVSAKWSSNIQGISGIDIDIQENRLVTIDGPVGSGKTSILMVIIRELEIDSGELIVNGVVSYASQEPWLFDSTVRQNIVFNEQFDEKRYLEVIKVCGLERDLQSLPAHDMTIVGDSGICLSGGQKSRINLARAVYRSADIYLLDDPLSSVDAAVAKYIFDSCIRDFLREKICILVTHQVSIETKTLFLHVYNCIS